MAGIAAAESGLGTALVGDNGTSFGLWQVHTPAWPQYNASSLTNDPNYNAQAAVQIFLSQGLGAWTTYTNGAYKQYLNGASTAAAPSITGSSSAPPTSSGPSTLPLAPSQWSSTTLWLVVMAATLVTLALIFGMNNGSALINES